MLRPVLQYPDPRLAQKSAEVTEINDEIRALAQDMLDTLKAIGGVGIAAPQIGIFKRVIILDLSQELKDPDAPQEFKALVNPASPCLIPRFTPKTKDAFPCRTIGPMVKRPRRVALDALDLDGNPVHLEGEGYYGAAMQHENRPSGRQTVHRSPELPQAFPVRQESAQGTLRNTENDHVRQGGGTCSELSSP